MQGCTEQRTHWLIEHVLPHERALRTWLDTRLHGGVGARLEADDVVQETWAVLASLESVRDIRSPRAYLFTVARSIILQHIRRARIVPIEAVADIDQLQMSDELQSPERRVAGHQELRRLAAQIADLPDRCREAFILRKVHGLSQREIAERMAISENTVEKHIGKALRLLIGAAGSDVEAVQVRAREVTDECEEGEGHGGTA